MDIETIYNNLIKEWELDGLPENDQLEILEEIAKTIHTQFLIDINNICGDENFKALEASLNMGNEFYETTLKHIVPNYGEVYDKAKNKVLKSYREKHDLI
jgi:SpoVK/Ycf46/Vps4 family AAA+-type ATPase